MGRVLLCKRSGYREFDTGQNWEIQKIRDIIYLERKGKAMSQGLSEKAHAATGLTDGSNLVYCATIYYTYK